MRGFDQVDTFKRREDTAAIARAEILLLAEAKGLRSRLALPICWVMVDPPAKRLMK
ncbi:MAG TPA: hypothetical protein VF088_18500 [Pyrinomonadaceae bacterium]